MLLQDVPGAAEAGGPHREVHVPLHRSLHVGGCRTAWEGDGGKSSLVLLILMILIFQLFFDLNILEKCLRINLVDCFTSISWYLQPSLLTIQSLSCCIEPLTLFLKVHCGLDKGIDLSEINSFPT